MPKCKCNFRDEFSEQWTLFNKEYTLLKLFIQYTVVHAILKMVCKGTYKPVNISS